MQRLIDNIALSPIKIVVAMAVIIVATVIMTVVVVVMRGLLLTKEECLLGFRIAVEVVVMICCRGRCRKR